MTDRAKNQSRLDADVLVVGAGLAGGTQALALARAGFSVIAVDRMDIAAGLDAAFDGRASAIAASSWNVLGGLGLGPALMAGACPMEDIRITDGDAPFFLHYDHGDLGSRPFGYMVENRTIRRALADAFATHDGLLVLAPRALVTLDRDASGVTATLDDGTEIAAGLVIGADGRASEVRRRANIKLTGWDYKQSGIVCTIVHERPHQNIAHEHFLPAGPFAILPLKGEGETEGRVSSLVWTERADLAPDMMALDDAAFQAEIQKRVGDFLGPVTPLPGRWCYPLSLQYAARTTDRRLALVADAAHGMHPIAGQGLNMGLRDVAALTDVLVAGRRLGLDVGDGFQLERYERWRRFDNTLMLAMTDILNRLFSNSVPPVRVARDLGLATVNKIPPLKKVFMEHAMGLVGDLPTLMRDRGEDNAVTGRTP